MTNQIPPLSSHPVPSRDAAWALLTEFTQSPSLLKHALAVESCVRAYGEQQAAHRGLVGDDITRLVDLYSATARRKNIPGSASASSKSVAGLRRFATPSSATQSTRAPRASRIWTRRSS